VEANGGEEEQADPGTQEAMILEEVGVQNLISPLNLLKL